MTELDDIIGAIISLFVIFLLGYVFYTVLSGISLGFAILFVLLIVVVAIGVVLKLIRG